MIMRLKPDRDEALALAAVWLMWPSFYFAAEVVFRRLSEFGITLPYPVIISLEILRSNRFCIPSLIGTGTIAIAVRFATTQDSKRFFCHVITLVSFFFTVATILSLLTILRAIK
jgi:small neutral amino acid transporter SnatA (MarC family)